MSTPAAPPPGPLSEGLVRDELVIEVARALAVVPHGGAVVVAVSGGPDSTALAYLTVEARPDLDVTLAHVRHGIRDDRTDLAVVHAHARNLGLPLELAEVVVVPDGHGWEAAARAQRYAALRRITRASGAGWLLVGHTAEDQAETVLMRLARGTGVDGLGGMAPVRGDLVRPLLRIRRNDVRRHVVAEGLDTVEDPTNRDPAFRRTTARHEVMPLLASLGPDPVGALARLADLARDDARRLGSDTAEIVASTTRTYGRVTAVPSETLASLDPALARRVVRHLIVTHSDHDDPPSAEHIATILAMTSGQVHELHGVRVTCGGGWLAVGATDVDPAPSLTLAVPGHTHWVPTRTDLVATTAASSGTGGTQLTLDVGSPWRPPEVTVVPDALPPGGDLELGQVVLGDVDTGSDLIVRSRRDGDRLRLAGGSRKLQDVLVDARIPRSVRDHLPVVTSGDRILWVPGVAVDHRAELAGRTDPQVHLAVAIRAR